MRFLIFAVLMSFAFTSPAQEKKTEKKTAQKKPVAKKKAEPKAASSQDWSRFSSSGSKTLDEKEKAKKDAKAKK